MTIYICKYTALNITEDNFVIEGVNDLKLAFGITMLKGFRLFDIFLIFVQATF